MSRVVLTDAKVRALKPGPRRIFIIDALCPRLVLDCTVSGHKSFMLRARWPGGRHAVRRLLGEVGAVSLDQARATAREWLGLLAQGLDPQRELAQRKRRTEGEQAATFSAVCNSYFQHQLRGRQAARSRKEIERELLPLWGERRISDISKGDVIQIIDALRARARRNVGERSSGAYGRIVYNHIRAIFQHAALRFDLERLPTDRLKPNALGLIARSRQRALDDREIAALWTATAQLGYPFGSYVRVLLLTGCRRSEIAGGRWSEIDFESKTWTIPRERAKSDSPHLVPITDDVAQLLASLPRFQSGDFVFSACWGRKPICGFSKYTTRLLKLMRAELGDMADFGIHDIRRSYRSKQIAKLRRELRSSSRSNRR